MKKIEYDSNNTFLVYQHEYKGLHDDVELIVRPKQEVQTYLHGDLLETFDSGRHILDGKTPEVKKGFFNALRNLFKKTPTNEDNPDYKLIEFYYFNKMGNTLIQWKTDKTVVINDPELQLLMNLSAEGQFALKVENPKLLMSTLVGSQKKYMTDDFQHFFKGKYMSIIKSSIVSSIQNKNIGFLEMPTHTSEISKNIEKVLKDEFIDYGISIHNFYIESLSPNREDYSKLQEMKQESIMNKAKVQDLRYKEEELGKAKAIVRKEQGYSYQEERRFDILEALTHRSSHSDDLYSQSFNLNLGKEYVGQIQDQLKNEVQNTFKEKK